MCGRRFDLLNAEEMRRGVAGKGLGWREEKVLGDVARSTSVMTLSVKGLNASRMAAEQVLGPMDDHDSLHGSVTLRLGRTWFGWQKLWWSGPWPLSQKFGAEVDYNNAWEVFLQCGMSLMGWRKLCPLSFVCSEHFLRAPFLDFVRIF